MKIKISKTQWEQIGKTAGWMDDEKEGRIYMQILKALDMPLEQGSGNRMTDMYAEIGFEDPLWGYGYIQVSKAKLKDNTIYVERYYDNETSQDESGKTVQVVINWKNPQETIDAIKKIVHGFKTTS